MKPFVPFSQRFRTAVPDGADFVQISHLSYPVNFLSLSLCLPAVTLLEKMLVFDPRKRTDCTDALAHAFLAQYHDPEDEPVAEKIDWGFSDAVFPIDTWTDVLRAEIGGALLFLPARLVILDVG